MGGFDSQQTKDWILIVANNKSKFKMNSDMYNTKNRQTFNFHQLLSNLLQYQK